MKEIEPYISVRGFVSRAADAKHLKTYEDLFFGLRLDYADEVGHLPSFIKDGSCGVIRFKSKTTSQVSIPGEAFLKDNKYPFTAHGFTSGKEGRLGVPEWHPGKGVNMELDKDAELWEVFSDGREILRGIYDTELKRFVKAINL